jgi:hypothetical protein
MVQTDYFRTLAVPAAMMAAALVAALVVMLVTQKPAEAGVEMKDGLCISGPLLCPPETTITSGPAGTIYVDWTSFEFSSSESGSTFECKLDDGTFGSCTSPKQYTDLSDGSHTFQVRAKDPQGDVDPTPGSQTWTVDTTNPPPPDTTPPQTSITSWSVLHVTNRTASYGFRGSDDRTALADLKFECRLNGDPKYSDWNPCTAPEKEYIDVEDGTHTFQVRAIDSANNVDPTPESRTNLFDSTPPDTKIESKPSDPSNVSTPTFEFSMIDNAPVSAQMASFFQCKYYPSSLPPEEVKWVSTQFCRSTTYVPPGRSTYTLPELPDGTYTFEVTAYDGWHRPDPTPAKYEWTVDATAPQAPVISSPSNDSYDTDGNIDLSGTAEEGSTVTVYDDDGSTSLGTAIATSGSWSFRTSALSESTTAHSLTATATDGLGNTSPPSEAVKVTVDKSAPTSSATAKDSAGSNYTSGKPTNKNVTVELSADDGSSGSGVKDVSYSINGGAKETYNPTEKIVISSEGESEISYYATDNADNQESPAKTFTVKRDKSAPTLDTDSSDGSDSITPDNRQTGVSRDIEPVAEFSDEMEQASLTTSAKLYQWNAKKKKWQSVPVAASVEGKTVTLNPYPTDTSRLLAANKKFKVTFTTGAKNLAGIPLSSNKSWTFTTGP